MTLEELLVTLDDLQIGVHLEGGNIRVCGPTANLTDDLLDQIRILKPNLIQELWLDLPPDPSRYLTPANLIGSPVVRIVDVRIPHLGGEPVGAPVLYFEGMDRVLAVRTVIAETMCRHYTEHMDLWINQIVKLSIATREYLGRPTKYVQVTAPKAHQHLLGDTDHDRV